MPTMNYLSPKMLQAYLYFMLIRFLKARSRISSFRMAAILEKWFQGVNYRFQSTSSFIAFVPLANSYDLSLISRLYSKVVFFTYQVMTLSAAILKRGQIPISGHLTLCHHPGFIFIHIKVSLHQISEKEYKNSYPFLIFSFLRKFPLSKVQTMFIARLLWVM